MKILTKPEELLLLSVCVLKKDAYGLKILKFVSEKTGYDWSVGSTYIPLDRLVRLGYLESYLGESTKERGGKRKRFFNVTASGFKALERSKEIQINFWNEIPELVTKK